MNEAMAKALIAVQSEMDSLPKNKTGYGNQPPQNGNYGGYRR